MIKRNDRNNSKTEHRKPVDVEQVLQYLNYKFKSLTEDLTDNSRGTKLHDYQTDFHYLITKIEQSPQRSVRHFITEANAFLAVVENAKTQ